MRKSKSASRERAEEHGQFGRTKVHETRHACVRFIGKSVGQYSCSMCSAAAKQRLMIYEDLSRPVVPRPQTLARYQIPLA